ncbi:hypothetical protein NDU88_008989 [Pleurodeles waltl]|uniref:Uncharacterized protein n=1 Tax=Pleurodeles waltl TaxID=8319 RepID=A0AAV7NXP3_PLEWA|nr:hypothetical protein NDU88_008989 [Pleurodeles waltl]
MSASAYYSGNRGGVLYRCPRSLPPTGHPLCKISSISGVHETAVPNSPQCASISSRLGGGPHVLSGLAAAGDPTRLSRLSLTRSSQDSAPQVVGAFFRQTLPQSEVATVPTRAAYSSTAFLQFSRPPVVIMAGFMLRAWTVARERRTTHAAPSIPGHAPTKFQVEVL